MKTVQRLRKNGQWTFFTDLFNSIVSVPHRDEHCCCRKNVSQQWIFLSRARKHVSWGWTFLLEQACLLSLNMLAENMEAYRLGMRMSAEDEDVRQQKRKLFIMHRNTLYSEGPCTLIRTMYHFAKTNMVWGHIRYHQPHIVHHRLRTRDRLSLHLQAECVDRFVTGLLQEYWEADVFGGLWKNTQNVSEYDNV